MHTRVCDGANTQAPVCRLSRSHMFVHAGATPQQTVPAFLFCQKVCYFRLASLTDTHVWTPLACSHECRCSNPLARLHACRYSTLLGLLTCTRAPQTAISRGLFWRLDDAALVRWRRFREPVQPGQLELNCQHHRSNVRCALPNATSRSPRWSAGSDWRRSRLIDGCWLCGLLRCWCFSDAQTRRNGQEPRATPRVLVGAARPCQGRGQVHLWRGGPKGARSQGVSVVREPLISRGTIAALTPPLLFNQLY
jgi:hypothetical protein